MFGAGSCAPVDVRHFVAQQRSHFPEGTSVTALLEDTTWTLNTAVCTWLLDGSHTLAALLKERARQEELLSKLAGRPPCPFRQRESRTPWLRAPGDPSLRRARAG